MRRVRHKKRGTEYEVIGLAMLQAPIGRALCDEAYMVVYRGKDGRLWVRLREEFEDGRFEDVPLKAVEDKSTGIRSGDLEPQTADLLTRPFSETIAARAAVDPAFRTALQQEDERDAVLNELIDSIDKCGSFVDLEGGQMGDGPVVRACRAMGRELPPNLAAWLVDDTPS